MLEAERLQEALTFDDVLLVPGFSRVLPHETDVSTSLTKNIHLSVPLLSAAMDTVTESRLAIALAQEGGLGVIHKNCSIEEQSAEIDKVKRSESGMISDPVTLTPNEPVKRALELMRQYRISGIPIVENDRKLVGIVTNRDLRFIKQPDIPLFKVMTSKNLVTVPVGTTLEEAEETLHRHRIEKLLVVDKKGFLKGLITIKDIKKRRLYPNACKDEQGRLRVGAAVGVAKDTLERAKALVAAGVDLLVVDTAHGHSEGVLRVVRNLRKAFSKVPIMAGNVVTAEAVKALADAGADIVKVGVGPGSACTTRVVAGVGVPQITAVAECAKAAAKYKVTIVADGGIKYSGDIAKAIAAGADAVMLGNLFAGTEESPGEVIHLHGRIFKVYYGMGSLAAMAKGKGSDRYFQEGVGDTRKMVPEGIESRVPYRGRVGDLVYQLVGGLRSAMGYCGAADLHEMKKKTRFVRITAAGYRESHPHDVIITKEAPNYYLHTLTPEP